MLSLDLVDDETSSSRNYLIHLQVKYFFIIPSYYKTMLSFHTSTGVYNEIG